MNGDRIFNTGRVAIGSNYQKPQQIHMDRDALRLQRALVEEPGADLDMDGLLIVAIVAVVIAMVLIPFWAR